MKDWAKVENNHGRTIHFFCYTIRNRHSHGFAFHMGKIRIKFNKEQLRYILKVDQQRFKNCEGLGILLLSLKKSRCSSLLYSEMSHCYTVRDRNK